MLLADEVDRVGLVEVGEGVALPLAGEEAGVAAAHELADDRRVVDRRLVAVLVDVVELRVHVHDLRHDVGPLGRVDVAVHVERQPGERAEALGGDARECRYSTNSPCRALMSASVAQISCSRSSSSARETHLAPSLRSIVGDIRRMVELKSATKPSRGESISAYSLADLQHLGRVRAERRVDLPAQREVEFLGQRHAAGGSAPAWRSGCAPAGSRGRARCGTGWR